MVNKSEKISILKDNFVDKILAPIVFFDRTYNIFYFNEKAYEYFDEKKLRKLKKLLKEKLFQNKIGEGDVKVFRFNGNSAILRPISYKQEVYYSITILEEEMQRAVFGRVVENIEIDEAEYNEKLVKGFFHDLKNVFQIIKGNAEILVKKGDDFSRKVANRILVSIEGAITLTKNFMAFYEAGSKETKPINIVEHIKKVWDSFKESVPKTVKLIENCNFNDEIYVRITPIEVQQILVNLLSNAVDAVGDKGEIELGFGLRKSDKNYFSLWLRDDGKGMDNETLKNIFKPYYTTKKSGTGLGLYLLYMIVKKRGGKISVHSEPGKGTKFRIYFNVEEKGDKKRRTTKSVKKGKALIVEDNVMYRTLVSKVLEEKGYQPIGVDTLKEAVKVYNEIKDFEIIVVDIILPDGNGVYLVERIKKSAPEIPIIITTSLRDTDVVEMIGDFSGIKFLRKPFVVERVNSIIDEVEKDLKKRRRVKK